MYLDCFPNEQTIFFKQRTDGFIPGYTGHCPTLKFRFGQCYGANTKQIMQEFSDQKIMKRVQREPYRHRNAETLQPSRQQTAATSTAAIHGSRPTGVPLRENGTTKDNVVQHRSRRYILGYTGYIPGLSFRYGKSYVRAADDCMAEFGARLYEQRRRFESERRARSAPQMEPIRGRDDVSKQMKDYSVKKQTRFKDHHLSPNSPPIAGYTGHIPRLANTETSLSQRYDAAARTSLAHLEKERRQRRELRSAERKVNSHVTEYKQRKNIN
ncbi:UPF0605 protein CG18335-like isoform X2 [Chrysoperla carnea]|uniref:UPF0605 protein CG18335-like isoform X2 n=1 Tax=Chrysoperla carnea TaxID=189513 RepID=UPI001D081CA4|nr:UPF0605 protein CG18335-like isoform X2 [Chrysoperla carnea]